jgi:RNA polymerase sigma-70 factor (ECF subfamily)
MTTPDDRELVRAASGGDQAAFRTLVERYQGKVYAVALGVLRDRDEAKDAAQEVFIKVYRNLASFEGDAKFFTWLYRIAMNVCIDNLRKKRGQKVEFDETQTSEEPIDDTGIQPHRLGFDPARALADKELRAQLGAALSQLSPNHRTVLVMREVEGLSYQEMADEMSCSIGTIMSRLFHARKKMQALLLEARGDRSAEHAEAPVKLSRERDHGH